MAATSRPPCSTPRRVDAPGRRRADQEPPGATGAPLHRPRVSVEIPTTRRPGASVDITILYRPSLVLHRHHLTVPRVVGVLDRVHPNILEGPNDRRRRHHRPGRRVHRQSKVVLDYTSRDFTAIRAQLIGLAKGMMPDWQTAGEPTDFGTLILELFAYMGDVLHFYIDRTAARRSSSRRCAAEGAVHR